MKTKVSFFLNNIINQHLILVTKAWFLICDITNKDIPYLLVYKSTSCISRPPTWGPQNKVQIFT